MLLLPFLPITALIMQNATTLSTLLTYQVHDVHAIWMVPLSDEAAFFQREVERIGAKVDAATLLEKFITNMQRERSEVRRNPRDKTVNLAFGRASRWRGTFSQTGSKPLGSTCPRGFPSPTTP